MICCRPPARHCRAGTLLAARRPLKIPDISFYPDVHSERGGVAPQIIEDRATDRSCRCHWQKALVEIGVAPRILPSEHHRDLPDGSSSRSASVLTGGVSIDSAAQSMDTSMPTLQRELSRARKRLSQLDERLALARDAEEPDPARKAHPTRWSQEAHSTRSPGNTYSAAHEDNMTPTVAYLDTAEINRAIILGAFNAAAYPCQSASSNNHL